CRCHDHKFDPFTQREFYQLFAYFNNVPEKGRAVKFGNSPPYIQAPTRDQEQTLAALDRRLAAAERRVRELRDALAESHARWEKSAKPAELPDWTPDRGLLSRFAMDGAGLWTAKDGRAVFAPGRLGKALDLDGKRFADAGNVG